MTHVYESRVTGYISDITETGVLVVSEILMVAKIVVRANLLCFPSN